MFPGEEVWRMGRRGSWGTYKIVTILESHNGDAKEFSSILGVVE